jgi:hypothetical protein
MSSSQLRYRPKMEKMGHESVLGPACSASDRTRHYVSEPDIFLKQSHFASRFRAIKPIDVQALIAEAAFEGSWLS